MIKSAGIALLAAAAGLLLWGCGTCGSMRLDFSQFLWGAPTDKIAWLFLGGAAALAMGLGLLLPSRPHESDSTEDRHAVSKADPAGRKLPALEPLAATPER